MSDISTKTIVLIAGQPKAGTTSLYDWLAQHPEVGAGKLKEIRFFLDPGYPLQAPDRFNGNNLDAYLRLFRNPERPVLLDASPDYIGCDTPLTLPRVHPQAKAILLFREPLERMISAYRFYSARGILPPATDFDGYVAQQDAEGVGPHTPSHMRALDHCREAHYVARWREAFGDNLLVLDFEDLRNDPQDVLDQVCTFIGIASDFQPDLTPGNPTKPYRSPRLFRAYSYVRRGFAQLTVRVPFLYAMFKPLGRLFVRSLESGATEKTKVVISDQTRQTIARYAGNQ